MPTAPGIQRLTRQTAAPSTVAKAPTSRRRGRGRPAARSSARAVRPDQVDAARRQRTGHQHRRTQLVEAEEDPAPGRVQRQVHPERDGVRPLLVVGAEPGPRADRRSDGDVGRTGWSTDQREGHRGRLDPGLNAAPGTSRCSTSRLAIEPQSRAGGDGGGGEGSDFFTAPWNTVAAPPSGGFQQRVDEHLRVEGCQVVDAFAQTDQLDRHAEFALDLRPRCRPWRYRRAWSARYR